MPHSAHSPAPVIRAFFDQPTNTISYLVADPERPEYARGELIQVLMK